MRVKRNIMINKVGGNAGKGAVNYRISLPAEMVREIGVTSEDRAVILEFDGKTIRINKEKEVRTWQTKKKK